MFDMVKLEVNYYLYEFACPCIEYIGMCFRNVFSFYYLIITNYIIFNCLIVTTTENNYSTQETTPDKTHYWFIAN